MTTTELALPNDWTAGSPTTPRRPAGQLASALRSEWIKFTSVRTNKVILAVAVGLGLLVSWATATFVTDQDLTVADVYIFPTLLTSVLAPSPAYCCSPRRCSTAPWPPPSPHSPPAERSPSRRRSSPGATASSSAPPA